MKPTLFVQLGRLGDILNVLPLCFAEYARAGERPHLMIAEQFAAAIKGVTYVVPLLWRGEFEDLPGALLVAEQVAETMGLRLICTQIYGRHFAVPENCSSFMRESWAAVPGSPPWGSLPLMIDRDLDAEAVVTWTHVGEIEDPRPIVLLALSGHSSPFAHGRALKKLLRNELDRDFRVRDLSGYLAPAPRDLLGLMRKAHCLVTVDSGLLHLAHAVPNLPVIAFLTREPSIWHGSPWRPNHVSRFFYDEAPECLASVAPAVRNARDPDARPRIVHVWSEFTGDRETRRRMKLARASWALEYGHYDGWRPHAMREADHWRQSTDSPVNDERPVPFMRDLIAHALNLDLGPTDVIALTNSDVCATPGLTGWILDSVQRHGAAFSHRWDFDLLESPLTGEHQVIRGAFYPGSDAFFFTRAWWDQHGAKYPDMLLGREHVDEVLRQLIKGTGGVEIHAGIYHEEHGSHWKSGASCQGNRYNTTLARRFFVQHGTGPNDHEWWRQPRRPY